MDMNVWIAGALGAGALLGARSLMSRGRIGQEGALDLLKDPRTFVLDVRSPEEFEGGRLERAVLIPHDALRSRAGELPSDKGTPILVYCAAGGRSAAAARILSDLGYSSVHDLKGGVCAWQGAGLPLVK